MDFESKWYPVSKMSEINKIEYKIARHLIKVLNIDDDHPKQINEEILRETKDKKE